MQVKKINIFQTLMISDSELVTEGIIRILRGLDYVEITDVYNRKTFLDKENISLEGIDLIIVYIDEDIDDSIFGYIQDITSKYSDISVLTIASHGRLKTIRSVLNIGIPVFLTLEAQKEDVIKAIESIQEKRAYFDASTVQLALESIIFRNKELEDLTQRELEIIRCIGKGMTNREISNKLFLGKRTVDNIIYRMYKKLKVAKRADLVLFALENGILR